MNESARVVLKNNKHKIRENLLLERGILDELEQKGTLTEDQVHTIWAETTNKDKINQLLFILPRRGPNAFTYFIDAIRKDSCWLADTLETELNKELDNSVQENWTNNSKTSDPSANQEQDEDVTIQSPSSQSDVPKRKRIKVPSYFESTGTYQIPQTSFNMIVEQNLSSLYTKLKIHLTSNYMREPSFSSPEPVTFEMVHHLVDEMLQNMDKYYSLLGAKDRNASLQTLIIGLKQKNTYLKDELRKKDEQRNKYANINIKLENKCREAQTKTKLLEKEIETLNQEKLALQDEVNNSTQELNAREERLKIISETYENEKVHNKETLDELGKTIEKLETQCKQYQHELEHMNQNRKRNGLCTGQVAVCSMCRRKFPLKHSNESAYNENCSSATESKLSFNNPYQGMSHNLGVSDENGTNSQGIPHIPKHSNTPDMPQPFKHSNNTRQTHKPRSEAEEGHSVSHHESLENVYHRETKPPISETEIRHERLQNLYKNTPNLHLKHTSNPDPRRGTRQNAVPRPPSIYRSTEFMVKREQRVNSKPFGNFRLSHPAKPSVLHSGLVTKSLNSLNTVSHLGNMTSVTTKKYR